MQGEKSLKNLNIHCVPFKISCLALWFPSFPAEIVLRLAFAMDPERSFFLVFNEVKIMNLKYFF